MLPFFVTGVRQSSAHRAAIDLTFHGKVNGTTLNGTADMTSRSIILDPARETATLSLNKQ